MYHLMYFRYLTILFFNYISVKLREKIHSAAFAYDWGSWEGEDTGANSV